MNAKIQTIILTRDDQAGEILLTFSTENGGTVGVVLERLEAEKLAGALDTLTHYRNRAQPGPDVGAAVMHGAGMLLRWRSRALGARSLDLMHFMDQAASELGALLAMLAPPSRKGLRS